MASIDACQALGEGSTPSSHTKKIYLHVAQFGRARHLG